MIISVNIEHWFFDRFTLEIAQSGKRQSFTKARAMRSWVYAQNIDLADRAFIYPVVMDLCPTKPNYLAAFSR